MNTDNIIQPLFSIITVVTTGLITIIVGHLKNRFDANRQHARLEKLRELILSKDGIKDSFLISEYFFAATGLRLSPNDVRLLIMADNEGATKAWMMKKTAGLIELTEGKLVYRGKFKETSYHTLIKYTDGSNTQMEPPNFYFRRSLYLR